MGCGRSGRYLQRKVEKALEKGDKSSIIEGGRGRIRKYGSKLETRK
jgi:hypothetical protein